MHEKFRHFIEDFQMKGCPAPPNLELLDFGCSHSTSPGRSAPGQVCVPCWLLPVPTGVGSACAGARGRYRMGMEAVSPSPFTNSCGDGQGVFEGNPAHSLFPHS